MKPLLTAKQLPLVGTPQEVLSLWSEAVVAQLAVQVPPPVAIAGADEVVRALGERAEQLAEPNAKPLGKVSVLRSIGAAPDPKDAPAGE